MINLMGTDGYSRFDLCNLSFFNLSCFLDLMFCGNNDGELWSAALLESVIIPSGQSVWHSAVAFQSPPSSPLVRHSSLPPLLAKADQSWQTCLYLCSSPLWFSWEITTPLPPSKIQNMVASRCQHKYKLTPSDYFFLQVLTDESLRSFANISLSLA